MCMSIAFINLPPPIPYNWPLISRIDDLASVDGLILIEPSEVADARMRMFNADGSESEMCGNGIRCVAKFVHDHDICRREQLTIETGGGLRQLQLQVQGGKAELITVDMGQPQTEPIKCRRHSVVPR